MRPNPVSRPWISQAEKPKLHTLNTRNSMSVKAAFLLARDGAGFSNPNRKAAWAEENKGKAAGDEQEGHHRPGKQCFRPRRDVRHSSWPGPAHRAHMPGGARIAIRLQRVLASCLLPES